MTATGGRAEKREIAASLLAGIRFHGQFEQLPDYFTRLRAVAHEAITGPALLLYRGRDPGGGFHLEAAYPVGEEVQGGGVVSQRLPAYQAWCLRRRGPADSPGALFREALDSASREGAEVTSDPPYAAVFLEERAELDPVEAGHEMEVRLPLLFPGWATQLEEGVERFAGPGLSREVFSKRTASSAGGPRQWAAWEAAVLKRLEAAVPDRALLRDMVKGCAHRFPDWRVERMRERYHELGSLDALLVEMRLDQSVEGQSWYESPVRVGETIYVTKDPADQAGWKTAPDASARRAAYCHCPLVAHAREAGVDLPAAHCFCGSGWYDQLWEGILGCPVRVEVLQSLLGGDECCTFAIHLPAGTV